MHRDPKLGLNVWDSGAATIIVCALATLVGQELQR